MLLGILPASGKENEGPWAGNLVRSLPMIHRCQAGLPVSNADDRFEGATSLERSALSLQPRAIRGARGARGDRMASSA